MRVYQNTTGNSHASANDLTILDDVPCTDKLCSGRRAYELNTTNPTRAELPSGHDIMLCDDPSLDLAAVVGLEAIVCLDSGQPVLRQVEQGSEPGWYDPRDRFSDQASVTHDIQPRWAAVLICGIVSSHWEKIVDWGQVRNIT
ncbi:hypothetical protein, partial [Heyndrickxia sporothermodurans]